MSCGTGENCRYTDGHTAMCRQEITWKVLQRRTHGIAVPSKMDLINSALRGNLAMQVTVTILHSCTGTTVLGEALNSEIKLSWCNARGRDSCQIINIRVALSGLTSLLAVCRSGEEQPLWLSFCFVVCTEVRICILASADSVAHQTNLQDHYFILIYSKATDKRQGMGEDKMKKKETLRRKQALPHRSIFTAVSTPCITSFFFNLNFLEAGEQTTWQEGGVDNRKTLSAWWCGICACFL